MDNQSSPRTLVPYFAALLLSVLVWISVVWGTSSSAGREAAGVVVPVSGTVILPAEPELSAHAYLVRVMGSDEVLLKRREWKVLPSASITKLLTAFVSRTILGAGDQVLISEEAKKVGEKSSDAPVGELFSRDAALTLLLTESANDVAAALAEATGAKLGKSEFSERIQIFVDLMNSAAQKIGMEHSLFKNPTGLDGEGHATTAQDLSYLAEYLWYNDRTTWEFTKEYDREVSSSGGRRYRARSTNELLGEFPALLGGKTGFTDNAKGTLLFLYPIAEKPRAIAIIVVLGSEDRFGDGRKIIEWIELWKGK